MDEIALVFYIWDKSFNVELLSIQTDEALCIQYILLKMLCLWNCLTAMKKMRLFSVLPQKCIASRLLNKEKRTSFSSDKCGISEWFIRGIFFSIIQKCYVLYVHYALKDICYETSGFLIDPVKIFHCSLYTLDVDMEEK